MTRTLLVAGTASHVGKSTVAAGLCRLLARRGVSVAPFKAETMSNNARVALTPDGEWGEIGVSQHVQARAARVPATTDVNPVLVKPHGDGESQLVVDGEAVGRLEAGSDSPDDWERSRRAAVAAHDRLAAAYDVVIAEGAGSIAEINRHDRDLANVETARFADATILLVADIERGGAFASLYGTIELLPADVRDRVAGAVITKFHGDRSTLEPGLEEIESRTGVPVLGVIPHDDPGLPAEDGVSLPDPGESAVFGDGDGVPEGEAATVAVPRLPRISNFTDLEPLAHEPGIRVAYRPLEATLDGADAVVLPGSKNTVDDLLALRGAGFDERLHAFEGPIVGLCGGYQMLGERIENAGVESTRDVERVEGIGLLPVETRFFEDKRVERVCRTVEGIGLIAGASGTVTGYEIHMGRTEPTGTVERPLGEGSAATDRVLGTYLHGLFENRAVCEAFVDRVLESGDKPRPSRDEREDRSPYDRAADLVADNVDLSGLDPIP